VIKELTADPKFGPVQVLVVDYGDKTTLRELNITDRSTLVAYRGAKERARSSFETDAAALRKIFESALQ
jgi:hypothetical protein